MKARATMSVVGRLEAVHAFCAAAGIEDGAFHARELQSTVRGPGFDVQRLRDASELLALIMSTHASVTALPGGPEMVSICFEWSGERGCVLRCTSNLCQVELFAFPNSDKFGILLVCDDWDSKLLERLNAAASEGAESAHIYEDNGLIMFNQSRMSAATVYDEWHQQKATS